MGGGGGGGDIHRAQVNRSLLYLMPKSPNLPAVISETWARPRLDTNRCEMIESCLLLGYINPLQCISKERASFFFSFLGQSIVKIP